MASFDRELNERIRRVEEVVARHGPLAGTYLFGSLAWGTPDADSDIDVAVFLEGVEEWGFRRKARVIADAQAAAGDDIELHLFPARFLDAPPPGSLARLVLAKGIRLEPGGATNP